MDRDRRCDSITCEEDMNEEDTLTKKASNAEYDGARKCAEPAARFSRRTGLGLRRICVYAGLGTGSILR